MNHKIWKKKLKKFSKKLPARHFDYKLIKSNETRNQSLTAANYYANAAFKSTHSRDARKKLWSKKISSRHILWTDGMSEWEREKSARHTIKNKTEME